MTSAKITFVQYPLFATIFALLTL